MYILESEQPDNFYLGKNNSSVEHKWKLAQAAADQTSANKRGGRTITWSSSIDWNGFPQDLSYAKTLDDDIIHVSKARDTDLVKISYRGKQSYMTKRDFEKHRKVIQPYLKKIGQSYLEDPYWKV